MKAAIIIGSNSLRMLLEEPDDRLKQRGKSRRFRQPAALFAGLDEKNRINKQDAFKLAEYINAFIKTAAGSGADAFFLGATSAMRDAENREEVCAYVKKTTGLTVNILTGKSEAALSFLGASEGPFKCGVVDIGGGSTEIATGKNGVIEKSASFQMGAARLFKKISINSEKDIDPAVNEALKAFYGAPFSAGHWYIAGGTAVILAHVLRREEYSLSLDDTVINFDDAEKILVKLSNTSRLLRSGIKGVPKGREDILPTGAAVLLALMQKYNINSLTATERGNLDGAIKAGAMGKLNFEALNI